MKKMIVIFLILCIIVISTIMVVNYKKNEKNNEKVLIDDTNKIIICNHSDDVTKICSDTEIIKEIDDKIIINKFIDIYNKLDIYNGINNYIQDKYTIYLLDKKDNIIISIDFYHHFYVKTEYQKYYLSTSFNDKIREILNIE